MFLAWLLETMLGRFHVVGGVSETGWDGLEQLDGGEVRCEVGKPNHGALGAKYRGFYNNGIAGYKPMNLGVLSFG
jgi:hypothetical protein